MQGRPELGVMKMGFSQVAARQLAESFKCPKCRGEKAVVRMVAFPKTMKLFNKNAPGKYLFLTCTLCGYTEIFDLALYAKAQAPAAEKSKSVLGQEA